MISLCLTPPTFSFSLFLRFNSGHPYFDIVATDLLDLKNEFVMKKFRNQTCINKSYRP